VTERELERRAQRRLAVLRMWRKCRENDEDARYELRRPSPPDLWLPISEGYRRSESRQGWARQPSPMDGRVLGFRPQVQ
jgi:hypothetical protein